ncbi:MAG: hypothetical protein JWO59_2207 [Chloroflexi bacterium]|nr:hypothetical protein [Chloroflexota bacterium]
MEGTYSPVQGRFQSTDLQAYTPSGLGGRAAGGLVWVGANTRQAIGAHGTILVATGLAVVCVGTGACEVAGGVVAADAALTIVDTVLVGDGSNLRAVTRVDVLRAG